MNTLDISLTEKAKEQMQQALAKVGKKAVHLSVREAGCSGLEYVMDYADKAQSSDLVCEFDGFTLYVDEESYKKALVGLEIDYEQDMLSSAFVYRNPNQKGECGCGVSFTI